MREIKFRAYYQNDNYVGGEKRRMIPWEELSGYDGCGIILREPTAFYTVMQCTGIKDKNGKEIYEGDIANITLGLVGKGGYTERGVMKWDENHAQFAFECNDSLFEDALGNPVNFKIEVIGNIYENPELLRTEK